MKKHYWLREDFDALMELLPGADIGLPGANKSGMSLFYPKHIEGAVAELKLRGLQVDGYGLQKLVDEGVVNPQLMEGSDTMTLWGKEDIDTAAEHLYENEQWSSWSHFCYVANIRYGQAVKAHRVAAARFGLGFTLGFDLPGLVSVIEPGHEPDDYAWIKFFPRNTNLQPQEAE